MLIAFDSQNAKKRQMLQLQNVVLMADASEQYAENSQISSNSSISQRKITSYFEYKDTKETQSLKRC